MGLFRRPSHLDPREVEALAGLRPLFDPILAHLLEGALAGRVEVYSASIPAGIVRPFDPDYNPTKHPVGRAAVDAVDKDWRSGTYIPVWLYQNGSEFVLSDDYITWEAIKAGSPDFIPAFLLGKPVHGSLRDIRGPMDVTGVWNALGRNPGPLAAEGSKTAESVSPSVGPAASLPGRRSILPGRFMALIRWLLLLPGALAAGYSAWLVVMLVNSATFNLIGMSPGAVLPHLFTATASSLALGGTVVGIGFLIAPSHRRIVSVGLAVASVVVLWFVLLPAPKGLRGWALYSISVGAYGAALVAWQAFVGASPFSSKHGSR